MPVTSKYDRINLAFERAVVQLQENLQYLVDKGKVSNKFISMQNNIIKAIINYQHQTEHLAGHLEWEILELTKGKIREIEQLKDIKVSLEAVCIIHGIMDFPLWMRKGKNYLISQAVCDHRANTITLPSLLKEKLDKLPEEEKKVLDKLLYKREYERIIELEKQIAQLKQRKK